MFRRFRAFEVPRTYAFKDPDTGFLYNAKTLNELYTSIIAYRVQNKLDFIEELPLVVENYICGLPENCNKCIHNEKLHRSLFMYIKGGIALLRNMAFKRYATQEEADKRGLQCISCEYNTFPDKSAFVAWADEVTIQQVGDRKSIHDRELGNCSVCTCVLKSKVFFDGKLDEFNAEETKKMRGVSCWQLKLSGQV